VNIDEVKFSVRRILDGLDPNVEQMEDGSMRVAVNSTAVYVSVDLQDFAQGDSRSVITITSPVLRNVVLTDDLYKWIATMGWRYIFGHVTFEDATGFGEINFQHHLLGDLLDAEELEAAVIGVVGTADELDDALRGRFGGDRFVD